MVPLARIARALCLVIPISLLVACSAQEPTPTPTAEPTATIQPSPTSLPAVDYLALIASLDPQAVLLQQDYEPGFTRPELHYPFGRLPPFTLYADGNLIYIDEGQSLDQQQVMRAQLSGEESADLLEQVADLGIEHLESFTENCRTAEDGTQQCVADASTAILRARLADGSLREVKIYADFANDPQAFQAIQEAFTGYTYPDAQAYQPEGATLFLSRLESLHGEAADPWPLDAAYLLSLEIGQSQARALTGDDLMQYLASAPANIGDATFEYEGGFYNAFIVPWLPGEDYRAEIAEQFPPPATPFPGTETPPAPPVIAGCPLPPPEVEERFQLVYVSERNAWIVEEGSQPVAITASGDVHQARLFPDGQTVAFTKQVGGNAQELWAVTSDGVHARRLAGGSDLTGSIEIGAFSDDASLIAFTHLIDERAGELWVANTDGSGARRLVSQEDLMAIIQEPLADSAIPTGLTWVPNTHVLIYDAFPRFNEEGIYIYVQMQNWAVDADNGLQRLLFPPGEGGDLSYAPDASRVAITAPDSLDLVDLATQERRPAGVGYFAIGFGEYYYFPPLVWEPDSQSLLLILPAQEGYNQDETITVWRVPADGSPATDLSRFNGFIASVALSPDQQRIAYWRAEPQSNYRELHIANVDGSQDIVYAEGDVMELLNWSPDSQHFVFWRFLGQATVPLLGDICGQPGQLLQTSGPAFPTWLDTDHFYYIFDSGDGPTLYLGTPGGLGQLLGSVDQTGEIDFVTNPVSE